MISCQDCQHPLMGHTKERCICQNGACVCNKGQAEVLKDNLAALQNAGVEVKDLIAAEYGDEKP